VSVFHEFPVGKIFAKHPSGNMFMRLRRVCRVQVVFRDSGIFDVTSELALSYTGYVFKSPQGMNTYREILIIEGAWTGILLAKRVAILSRSRYLAAKAQRYHIEWLGEVPNLWEPMHGPSTIGAKLP
jgi:hypothetical protein